MDSRRFVAVLALVAAAHAMIWTCLVPPGQGGDEDGHFAYVEFLLWKKRIPVMNVDFNLTKNFRSALNETDFAMVRMNPFARTRFIEIVDRHPPDEMEPNAHWCGPAAGPPLYYLLAAPAAALAVHGGVIDRLYAARLLGAALAACAAALGFLAARCLVGDGPLARTTGWILALQPQAHFIFGCVTADAGTMVAVALSLWFLACIARGASTAGWATGAGLAAGAAYLMKPFAGSMLPAIAAAFLLHGTMKDRARAWFATAAAAALLCLPWLAWSYHHYGGPSGFSLFRSPSPDPLHRILLDALRQTTPWTLFSQAVGVFGHLDAPLPVWLRLAVAVLFSAGWLRFAWLAMRRRIPAPLLVFALAPIIHTLFVFAVRVWTTASTGYAMGLQGRYFFLPLAAWILPCLIGLDDPGWPAPVRRGVSRILRAGALFLALYAIGWTVIPRYYL